jgi:AraC-like DNA-binding protein
MSSTSDETTVEVGDSFDHWHQVTCRNYAVSESRRDLNEAFGARISSQPFGPLVLTDAASSMGATQLDRGPVEIRKDPRDHFMLFLVTDGEIGIAQDGREARAQTGDLFLYDETRPLILEFQRRYHTIMLNIPRPLLESRLPPRHPFTARLIAGNSKLGALAGGIIRELVGFDERTSVEIIERVSAAALDIVATAIEAETLGEVVAAPGRHRLLGQVETYLLANLSDSQLDIDMIASATNMTPRTLNRVFAAEGTTPMRWLWRQRLTASYRALAEGHIKSVTDAALTFGFSDVSHFSRVFKSAFGKSPSAVARR